MSEKIDAFLALAETFKDKGFSLYLVGGTVRDFFLNVPLTDMDLVTDATPSQMKTILGIKNADYTFEKYGYVKYKLNDLKLDITTLRKEKRYKDGRHPNKVKFVRKLKVDVRRRDFTINGLYLDDRFNVYDYVNGKKDIDSHVLKMIGNPRKRLKEDPLRIIRAIRFSIDYSFHIEDKLSDEMIKLSYLVDRISKDKIKQEIKKIKSKNEIIIKEAFTKYGLVDLLLGGKK